MKPENGRQDRPLVTFAVLAYQQEELVRQAIEAAFAQTYSPLEIILSDDGSGDRTFEVIERMAAAYDGPHSVRVNRNRENLGLIGHVNAIFEMARGEIVLLAAGDDVSLPERTERVVSAFGEGADVMLVHTPVERIDAAGTMLGLWHAPMRGKPDDIGSLALSLGLHLGASAGYRKVVFDRFGPIVQRAAYEDLVLGFRARLLGRLVGLDLPLVRYRVDTGMTKKDKPLEKRVRTQRRVRALEMMRAVFRQRMADLESVGERDLAVLSEMEARLRDVETRLAYHDAPGCLLDARRPGRIVDVLRAVCDEARREFTASAKARLRGLIGTRSRSLP